MSAEGVASLEKANCKRQRESDDVIDGKKTRLRCKIAKAQQMVELDTQNQSRPNATLSTEAQETFKSSSTELAPAKIAYKEQPVLLKTIKLFPPKTANKPVTGIATIGDKSFIVCDECPVIFIYTVATLEYFSQFKIRCLECAFDMVSCPRYRCLYIMDQKIKNESREILKVDTNGKVILRWSVGFSWGLLSMTHESNLLFTDRAEGKLKEFSAEGKLVLDVAFPQNPCNYMYDFSHAIKLTNGNFVLSHRGNADLLHRISLLDNKGVVLMPMNEDPNALKLKNSMYLAVDSDDSILLSDDENSRVLLLSSNLEFKRELLTMKDGLRHSWISLDELNGRLFVVDHERSGTIDHECRLLVFDVR